jgi:hypothetical protein
MGSAKSNQRVLQTKSDGPKHEGPMPKLTERFLAALSVDKDQDGRRARLRTAPGPTIDPICRALGIALPPVFQELPPIAIDP